MLSISTRSAEGAVKYYLHLEKDSKGKEGEYYSAEGEGQWMGNGADALGLSGAVKLEDFANLVYGYAPDGRELANNAGEGTRRGGYDLTFSAPKSVSVAWSVASPEVRALIEQAHDNAVNQAFGVMQDRAGYARTGAGGVEHVRAELVAAQFRHGTSREQDAQLHTHVFVMNCARRDDGNYSGVASERLYAYKTAGGAAYQVALGAELSKAGFVLERDGDSFRMAQVPRELEQEQSTRRNQIKEHMAERGTSGGKAAATAALATRKAKGEIDLPELRNKWTQQGEKHGYTAAQAKPERQLQSINEPKESKNDSIQRLQTTVQQIKERSPDALPVPSDPSIATEKRTLESIGTIGTLDGLRELPGGRLDGGAEQPAKLLPSDAFANLADREAASPDGLRRTEQQRIAEGLTGKLPSTTQVLNVATKNDAIIRDPQILTAALRETMLKGNLQDGLKVAKAAKARAVKVDRIDGQKDRRGTTYTTRALLKAERNIMNTVKAREGEKHHQLSKEQVSAAIERAEQAKGYQLNAEQKQAVSTLCTQQGGISAMVGDAGTGKSTTMYAVREAYEANGYAVIGTSTGGKASAELASSAGIDSRNMAQLSVDIERGDLVLTNRTVIVVDEAGMVDSRAMDKVMTAAEAAGSKVILVGDYKQLQPVGAGETFRAVVGYQGDKVAHLEDNMRQRESWEREAVKEMSQGDAVQALGTYAEHGRVHIEPTYQKAIDEVASRHIENMKEVGPTQAVAIAGTNQAVNDINERVRDALKEDGQLKDGTSFDAKHGGKIELATGDRVMLTSKDKESGAENGDAGTITRINHDTKTVELTLDRTGEIVTINPAKSDLSHGYAMTTHKSQGSTYERATVYTDVRTSREMSYVQASRAKDETHFVTTRHNVERMREDAPSSERLKEAVDKIADARQAEGLKSGLEEGQRESFKSALEYVKANKEFNVDSERVIKQESTIQAVGQAMTQSKPKETTLDYKERETPQRDSQDKDRQEASKQKPELSDKDFKNEMDKVSRAMEQQASKQIEQLQRQQERDQGAEK